jgi:hypothetical protein
MSKVFINISYLTRLSGSRAAIGGALAPERNAGACQLLLLDRFSLKRGKHAGHATFHKLKMVRGTGVFCRAPRTWGRMSADSRNTMRREKTRRFDGSLFGLHPIDCATFFPEGEIVTQLTAHSKGKALLRRMLFQARFHLISHRFALILFYTRRQKKVKKEPRNIKDFRAKK